MRPRILVLALVVVSASCSSSASQSSSTRAADEAAVTAAMNDYLVAIRSNDASKIAAWWTEDALYIDRKEPTIHGRAGLDSSLKDQLKNVSVTQVSVDRDDLAVSGDLSYFLGRYHAVYQPRQGAAIGNSGRFVFIWKRQPDGTWKIARSVETDLASSSGPAAAQVSSKADGT
jgi:uncharacterized protein (TIGR02246 family)